MDGKAREEKGATGREAVEGGKQMVKTVKWKI